MLRFLQMRPDVSMCRQICLDVYRCLHKYIANVLHIPGKSFARSFWGSIDAWAHGKDIIISIAFHMLQWVSVPLNQGLGIEILLNFTSVCEFLIGFWLSSGMVQESAYLSCKSFARTFSRPQARVPQTFARFIPSRSKALRGPQQKICKF